jgi:hypothetical protein
LNIGRLALLVALLGGVVITTPFTAAYAQNNAQYEEVKAKAKAAFGQGEYDDAAIFFREAFDIEPRSSLLYNIGLCYEKSGNTASAVVFYERYVSASPGSAKAAAVKRKVDGLKQQLEGSYETVQVKSSPSGAMVFVDDKSKGAMGTTPLDFRLLPGTYTLIVEKSGYEPAKQQIRLSKGRDAKVAVRLVSTSQVGAVTLFISERNAQISVDGKAVGKTPLQGPLRLAAGQHEIEVMKPGFARLKKMIEVKAGQDERVQLDLATEAGGGAMGSQALGAASDATGSAWPWVVTGVGVAALGGAAFTALTAQGLHDQLTEKQKKGEPIAPQDIDTGNNMVMYTNVLAGVGGALVVGGLTWWFFDGSLPTAGSTSLGFGPTPEGGSSVQIMGTF